MTVPDPVDRDSRGILDPWLLRRRVRLERYPPGDALDGLVDRFWTVRWDLPEGVRHRQEVLTHPGANLTVGSPDGRSGADPGTAEARLTGVAREVVDRELVGRGGAVAALFTPGGIGAFLTVSAQEVTDRTLGLDAVTRLNGADLVRRVGEAADDAAGVEVLRAALVAGLDPERAAGAREVAALARLAETDRGVRRLDDLAARAGLGPRTLQRSFLRYAGVSPTWVLRRYRLLDAAESVRAGEPVVWSEVAAALGYADQAHLVRDFRATLGRTPAAYARQARPRED